MVKDTPSISLVSCKPARDTKQFHELLKTSGFEARVYRIDALSELFRLDLSDDIVLVMAEDFDTPEINALHIYRSRTEHKIALVVDVLQEHFVRAVHNICDEFIINPVDQNELLIRIARLTVGNGKESNSEATPVTTQRMIGDSEPFIDLLNKLAMVSLVDAPVLIQGETGTGKELAARAIHYQGRRKGQPFIPVNCGTLPDELLENELFGHEQGAFTDAKRAHKGLVAQAEGGTLFLDEIETLSYKGQVALLRFLQESEFRPLGSKCSYKSDIRVVSASNADLKRMVEDGCFREDLYFRLNVLPIDIPPLRERIGDIDLLIDFYWQKFQRMYPGTHKVLSVSSRVWMLEYKWPGNIRELENLLHREYILSASETVGVLPPGTMEPDMDQAAVKLDFNIHGHDFNTAKNRVIADFEKSYLTLLMHRCQGNVSQAARYAGKERRSLGKLLKKYGINRASYL